MRIIIYDDLSIIVDEVLVEINDGVGSVALPVYGYIPGTLYLMTGYPYDISDDLLLTISGEDGVIEIPFVYTTNLITGHVEYTVDGTAHLSVTSTADDIIYGHIGIGSTPPYADVESGDDIIEYSLLDIADVPPGSTTFDISDYIDHSISTIIDLDQGYAHRILTLERRSGGRVRYPYPGTLLIDGGSIKLDRGEYMIDLGIRDDIDIEYTQGSILIDIPDSEIITLISDNDISSMRVTDPTGIEIGYVSDIHNGEMRLRYNAYIPGVYTLE